jgi:hypothetical protein
MPFKPKNLASYIFFFNALVILPFIGSLIVLGASYALNKISGVGVFPSAMIFLATLFTGIVAIGFGYVTREIHRLKYSIFDGANDDDDSDDDYDDDEDEDDEDAWTDEEERRISEERQRDWVSQNLNLNPTSKPSTPSVGRNHPCPCGSNKKYKMCCLRKQELVPDEIPF